MLVSNNLLANKNLKKIIGVLSDGDLRRIIDKRLNIHNVKLAEVMNKQFKFIHPDALVTEAINIMQSYRIFSLPVILDEHIVGIFNMHDLLKTGIL